MSALPALHSKQVVTKLSGVVSPPLAKGMKWSIINFAPSAGVLPQYTHLKPSLLSILNLTFKWLLIDALRVLKFFKGLFSLFPGWLYLFPGLSLKNGWLGLLEIAERKGT